MGLGAGVYFDKLPAASPFICAGILRKEVCFLEAYISPHDFISVETVSK